MPKKKRDTAAELEALIQSYDAYKDADINFLLKRLMMDNDRRYYDFSKRVEDVRQDYREGKRKSHDKMPKFFGRDEHEDKLRQEAQKSEEEKAEPPSS
jgi:hypothetical protein